MMHTLAPQYKNLQALWQGLFAPCCAVAMLICFCDLTNKLTNVARVPHFSTGDNGARIWRGRPASGHLVMQIKTVMTAHLLV
jgi:hypothetical protein